MLTLPIYNIVLDDAQGITKMSLVDAPAVESDFIAFSKQDVPLQFSVDEQQHIVLGVALRADFPIYRRDKSGYEYFVVFHKDTIKQLRDKFMKEQRTNLVNLDHTEDTEGCYLIDSFIKDTSKGIAPSGFDDITDGSWFVAYKIDNPDVWKQVQDGTFKGFSIEGTFCLVEQKQEDDLDDILDDLLS